MTQSPAALDQLLEYLEQNRGFDFTAYKRATLARRIDKRMVAVGHRSYFDYLDYLQVHPDEFDQLFNAILINVTSFFRDSRTFDYLREEIVPAILKARAEDEPIRIWSAGCASGEECYSIAILFAEAAGDDQYKARVKIYATDLDEEELTTARQASYSDEAMKDVPEVFRAKYFDRNGGHWTFKKDYRRNVIFGRHDLLGDSPISRLDLLLCRNTLMYFNQEAQSKIVSRFHFALREGGYLVLGKAEMLVNFANVFVPINLKQRVFQKVRADNGSEPLLFGYPIEREERLPIMNAANRMRDMAFDQDPTIQMVFDAKGHMLLANSLARGLFRLDSKDIGRPLQDLELSYRPVDLRSCIDDAHVRRQAVQLRDVTWPTASGDSRYFNVQVVPMFDAAETALGTKIVFYDVTRQHELQQELVRSRQELETAYEELQSTNEELETTNEELQSTVEELETTNEELQSTNEELETMNEELQSTNEELETVNTKLQQRGVDLTRTNVFMSGILRSVPLGIVVLDEELHVELWNDVATELWGVRQDEVRGKHFLGLDIGLPVGQLRQPLLTVAQTPHQPFDTVLDATNRRGRRIQVRVQCASIQGPDGDARGVILLMQEADQHN
jgi:two-component system CheB/CheR fusion protein